jgi:acetyl esterase/lipase
MSNRKHIIYAAMLVSSILAGSLLATCQAGLAEEQTYIEEKDIVYANVDGVELKLDLARPEKGRRLPAVIFIFGGSWRTGSRTQYSSELRKAAEKGYLAVTIDHRLTKYLDQDGKPKYQFPDQIHDVKCAVRWLRANAKKYRIDPNRIGAVGWSSGGYLALMLGLTDPSDGLEGDCGDLQYSSKVDAVVSLAGYTELKYFVYDMACKSFLGGTPEEIPEVYKKASPVTYVDNDDPPVLIIHADNDGKVPFKQAEILDAKMNEVGADHILITKKGLGHGVFVDNDVWDFLDMKLKGEE